MANPSPRVTRVNMTQPMRPAQRAGNPVGAPPAGAMSPGADVVAAPRFTKHPTVITPTGVYPMTIEARVHSVVGVAYFWEQRDSFGGAWEAIPGPIKHDKPQITIDEQPAEALEYRCVAESANGTTNSNSSGLIDGSTTLGYAGGGIDDLANVLDVGSGQGANFQVGDVCKEVDGDELFVVDSINVDDVGISRGWDGTTPEAIAAGKEIVLVWRAAWEQSGAALSDIDNDPAGYDEDDTAINVTSGAGFSAGMLVQGDGLDEVIRVANVAVNALTLERSKLGTAGEALPDALDVYELRPVGYDA